jgi:hypothetical protein
MRFVIMQRCAFLTIPALLLGACSPDRDWNPTIRNSAELVGDWRDGAASLKLDGGGSYTCAGGTACSPLGTRGTWQREGDFYVAFRPAAAPAVEWRVSLYRGHFQLVAGDTQGDPDQWAPRPTFERRVPAS